MEELFEKLKQLYPETRWYGPYVRSDKRAYVIKADTVGGKTLKGGRKSSIMLSKALLEAKLGRRLTEFEQADHIDANPQNDSLDNLQVLSIVEHRKKTGIEEGKRTSRGLKLTCENCKQEFICRRYRFVAAENRGKTPSCSSSCASRLYGRNQYSSWGALISVDESET